MKYRISKYHPLFSKHVDDWTSITDVGKGKYGLTLGEYRQYEDKYIESVLILIGDDHEEILISGFESTPVWDRERAEKYGLDESVFGAYQRDQNSEVYTELYNGKRAFGYGQLPQLLKILLRDEAWFVMTVGDYKIDIGFDLYVHIEAPCDLTGKRERLPEGIYLEEV